MAAFVSRLRKRKFNQLPIHVHFAIVEQRFRSLELVAFDGRKES